MIFRTSCCLTVVITCHFTSSIFISVISTITVHFQTIQLVYNLVTILWVLIMACLYFAIYKDIYIASMRQQKQLATLILSKELSQFTASTSTNKIQSRLTLVVAVKIMLVVTVCCFICIGFHVYNTFVFDDVLLSENRPDWVWWICEIGERAIELCICILLSYVATQPYR